MKAYRIDELSPDDIRKITDRLTAMGLASELRNLFWLPVPDSMLSPEQKEHEPICGPYVRALEALDDAISLEFLVRAKNKISCRCVRYASMDLVFHMMKYVDDMLQELHIRC